jgi:hypothetical protein
MTDYIKEPERVLISDLKPHPRNYKTHPPEQVEHIKAAIRRSGMYKNVVIANDSTILAGHGVVLALTSLGASEALAVRLDCGPDDPEAIAVMAGDNEIARMGVRDDKLLAGLLTEVREKDPAGLMGTGYTDFALDGLLSGISDVDGDDPNVYTRKIEPPIYRVTGEKPDVSSLVDRSRLAQLLGEIEAADIDETVKDFLRLAAHRHCVFDYEMIAEYYAHASAPIQKLMEDSALIIIDFDRAIELGFIKLTHDIADVYRGDYER